MRTFVRMRRAAAALLVAAAVSGCVSTGPEKTLHDLADALNANDAEAFLELLDGGRLAQCEVRNMIREDRALSMLNDLGKRLKLGGMQELLGQALDVERELLREYEQGVSTGSMMAECRSATSSGCPWVPESLKAAEIREISPTAAVARVITPARMTTWLALQQRDGRWRVVGKASLESTARDYALDQPQPPAEKPSAEPGGSVTRL